MQHEKQHMGDPIYTTLALGEEDRVTTMALGEEQSPVQAGEFTTLAVGEEDRVTTLALGEEQFAGVDQGADSPFGAF